MAQNIKNKKYLSQVSPSLKSEILANIASQYFISEARAEQEVTSTGAEWLPEYIVGNLRFTVKYQMDQMDISAA